MSKASLPDADLKAEVFRMLNPRWLLFRAHLLRETGYSWKQIGEAMGRHESTAQNYYRAAKKELAHEGTLWFLLTTRTRTILMKNHVDPKGTCAADMAEHVVRKYKGMPGANLGPATCNEILNAVDEWYESHRKQPAGE